uniref:Uncharacterized protein n=1 Tax=Arundo donax TaxID=35708 RepID=A0A0A9RGR1_ARUDO
MILLVMGLQLLLSLLEKSSSWAS